MYSNSGLPLCRHVKANGESCGAPALRGKFYCYFHYRMRACDIRLAATSTLSTPRQGGGHPHDFTIGLPFPPEQPGVPALCLPLLEDANAVQCAIQLVLQNIVMGVLDSRRASLLLYGLQIASLNLKKTRFMPWPTDLASNPDPFTERTLPEANPDEEDEKLPGVSPR